MPVCIAPSRLGLALTPSHSLTFRLRVSPAPSRRGMRRRGVALALASVSLAVPSQSLSLSLFQVVSHTSPGGPGSLAESLSHRAGSRLRVFSSQVPSLPLFISRNLLLSLRWIQRTAATRLQRVSTTFTILAVPHTAAKPRSGHQTRCDGAPRRCAGARVTRTRYAYKRVCALLLSSPPPG